MRTSLIGGQLARRYGVPYRSSNVNAANALDAQAAYESVFSLWGAIMGARQPAHAWRRLDGGRAPRELREDGPRRRAAGMVEAFLEPVVVDDASLALDAIAEVGPGGHFFGVEHTQERFKTAFHKPMLSRLAELRDVAGGRVAGVAVEGEPDLEGAARRVRAAADGPGHPRGARRVRRAARRRGRRPDRLLIRPSPGSSRGSREARDTGRRHRWGRRRRERPVPPDEGGLDRRDAARAARAHGGFHLARRGRDAHAQRRSRTSPDSSSTRSSCTRRSSGSPARTVRSTCRAA